MRSAYWICASNSNLFPLALLPKVPPTVRCVNDRYDGIHLGEGRGDLVPGEGLDHRARIRESRCLYDDPVEGLRRQGEEVRRQPLVVWKISSPSSCSWATTS